MNVRPQTSFETGERVSYQSFGYATIVSVVEEHVAGYDMKFYVLQLDSGGIAKVPVTKAHASVTRLSTDFSLAPIIAKLCEKPQRPSHEHWRHTEKRYLPLLSSRNPVELAEIVRDFHPRGKDIKQFPRNLYQAALSQLVDIISESLGEKNRGAILKQLADASGLSFHQLDAAPTRYVASTAITARRRTVVPPAPALPAATPLPRRVLTATPPKARAVPRQAKPAPAARAKKEEASGPKEDPLPPRVKKEPRQVRVTTPRTEPQPAAKVPREEQAPKRQSRQQHWLVKNKRQRKQRLRGS